MPIEALALLKALRSHRHFFQSWAQHAGTRLCHQGHQASRVVGMVVRD
jgi:hypothetical protein